MIPLDKYKVRIKLLRDMLGTISPDLNVMDKHILDRQRKLIAENSKINKAINKYLDAKDISDEKGERELSALALKVEEMLGRSLGIDEIEDLRNGDLSELKDLKETFAELDSKGITCFYRDPSGVKNANGFVSPCISSHMILGFLKASGEAISRTLPQKKGTVLHSSSYTSSIINQHVTIKEEFLIPTLDIRRNEDGTPKYNQRPLKAMTAQGPRVSLARSEVLPAGAEFTFTLLVMSNSQMDEKTIRTMFSYGEMKGLGQWRNSGLGAFEVLELEKL